MHKYTKEEKEFSELYGKYPSIFELEQFIKGMKTHHAPKQMYKVLEEQRAMYKGQQKNHSWKKYNRNRNAAGEDGGIL